MTDGMRKAALLLSSLGEQDRAWMLARVDDEDRQRLSSLLVEVRELGIGLDAGGMRALVQAAPPPPPAAASAEPAGKARALDMASARAVHDVLARESDRLIAIVLRARPWKWREAFQKLLGTERRLRVKRAYPTGALPTPRATDALLAAIEARLDDYPGESDATEASPLPPPVNGMFRKLWSELPQWRR